MRQDAAIRRSCRRGGEDERRRKGDKETRKRGENNTYLSLWILDSCVTTHATTHATPHHCSKHPLRHTHYTEPTTEFIKMFKPPLFFSPSSSPPLLLVTPPPQRRFKPNIITLVIITSHLHSQRIFDEDEEEVLVGVRDTHLLLLVIQPKQPKEVVIKGL